MSVNKIVLISAFVVVLASCDIGSEEKSRFQLVEPADKKNHVESTSESIASVAGTAISTDVLRYYIAQKGFGVRNKELDKESLSKMLDEIIMLELYKQAAIKNKMDKDPSTELAMSRILSSRYQAEVLAKNANLIKVSDEEVQARYEKNKQKYAAPARRRGAVISVRLSADADVAEHKKAKSSLSIAREKSLALSDAQKFFGDLAASHSDDVVSKSRRGDIGWVVEGASINRYESVVINTLFSLDEVGEVSSVIKGERAYYLIKLVDSTPAKAKELKQVERVIRKDLLSEKNQSAELQITNDLSAQFGVSIDESAFNNFIANLNTKSVDESNMPPSFPVSVK